MDNVFPRYIIFAVAIYYTIHLAVNFTAIIAPTSIKRWPRRSMLCNIDVLESAPEILDCAFRFLGKCASGNSILTLETLKRIVRSRQCAWCRYTITCADENSLKCISHAFLAVSLTSLIFIQLFFVIILSYCIILNFSFFFLSLPTRPFCRFCLRFVAFRVLFLHFF